MCSADEKEKKHERGQLWCDKIQHESGKVRKIWKYYGPVCQLDHIGHWQLAWLKPSSGTREGPWGRLRSIVCIPKWLHCIKQPPNATTGLGVLWTNCVRDLEGPDAGCIEQVLLLQWFVLTSLLSLNSFCQWMSLISTSQIKVTMCYLMQEYSMSNTRIFTDEWTVAIKHKIPALFLSRASQWRVSVLIWKKD